MRIFKPFMHQDRGNLIFEEEKTGCNVFDSILSRQTMTDISSIKNAIQCQL